MIKYQKVPASFGETPVELPLHFREYHAGAVTFCWSTDCPCSRGGTSLTFTQDPFWGRHSVLSAERAVRVVTVIRPCNSLSSSHNSVVLVPPTEPVPCERESVLLVVSGSVGGAFPAARNFHHPTEAHE